MAESTCSAEGCGRPVAIKARGLCRAHYQQQWKLGLFSPFSLADRLWAKIVKTDDCWEWSGYRNAQGYGMMGAGGKVRRVHRIAYELEVGPIPDGLDVLHHCDNPPCCRPDHLFLGTDADNMADMMAKGRSKQRQRTHCPKGHPYDEANTFISFRGAGRPHRHCRECSRESVRRRRTKGIR